MEKRVYFLDFNRKILLMDTFSVLSGLIGIILGALSIFALQPYWDSQRVSVIFTLIAIGFDSTSFCLAFLAFFWMIRLIRLKSDMIKQNMKLYYKDWISIWCDFSSFLTGLIGTICEIISIVVLLPQFNNDVFSYQITIVAITFDALSVLIAIIASLITLNIIKNYRLRGNSIV